MNLASPSLSPKVSTASALGGVYRLADHLDATLALAEDLLTQSCDAGGPAAGDGHDAITTRNRAIIQFTRTIRAQELAIVSRLIQARARASELRPVDPRFAPLLALFVGATAVLADAAAGRDGGLGDISPSALTSGPDVLHFLASRAVVPPGAVSLGHMAALAVTENYLLSAQIHLGTLMDMVAQLLETLDLAFDLYAEPRSDVAAA
jgi:hypothetical protein